MKTSTVLSGLALLAQAMAQQVGTQQVETHPKLAWKRCTGANSAGKSCTTVNGEVVIDANWRWAHLTGNTSNCFDGNAWTGVCKTNTECATNCAVEGADYPTTYGVTTSGDALTLKFVTTHQHGTNVGSRMYLLDGPNNYQMFTLMNNEFAFDVDLSSVKCGMNSALYFVPMKADGGLSTEPNNKAGARYGTGYCDAQCARDLKFINGKANVEGWQPSKQDKNAGVGVTGACCAEIDIWESNSQAYAFTPHTCAEGKATYHTCEGKNCGGTYSEDRFGGYCDANGCDYNAYRAGNHEFYGPGKTVDTNSKFTVISRFQPNDHYQVFIQNGKVIQTPAPSLPGLTQFNGHITDAYCNGAPALFGDRNRHEELGGASTLDPALRIPMVLVMSIWADFFAQMLWLDGLYPEDSTAPGALRGRCPAGNRDPGYLVSTFPNASVTWSNIRFGPIGSTHDTTGSGPVNPPTTTQAPSPVTTTTRAPPTTTTAPPPGGAVAPKWGQCGGQGWTGPTQCAAGSTCTVGNPWYSQCL